MLSMTCIRGVSGMILVIFCDRQSEININNTHEPITWSVRLLYWAYVTAFSQNGLFSDYLFAGNRLLELTWVIRSMKREEKKWRPYAGTSSYLNYANSAFLLLYSSIPILHFLMYPTILCTGSPSFNCEMIVLHNDSRSGIIRVCMRICTTALRNKTIG